MAWQRRRTWSRHSRLMDWYSLSSHWRNCTEKPVLGSTSPGRHAVFAPPIMRRRCFDTRRARHLPTDRLETVARFAALSFAGPADVDRVLAIVEWLDQPLPACQLGCGRRSSMSGLVICSSIKPTIFFLSSCKVIADWRIINSQVATHLSRLTLCCRHAIP